MRKEIRDFIKAESRPNQHERNDDPRELMWAIVDIYEQRKADAITLQNDLEALVFESRLHKNYKDASILEGLNPQQTENDHEAALFDVNNCIDYLIMTAKKWGVTLPESVIQKYDCMNYGRDYTLADFIRWQYGTNTKKTSLDNLNDPEKLAKAVKLLEQMLLDQNDNDTCENEPPADTSTPSAEIMEDATDLTPATANNEKQEKGKAGKKKYKEFREYFLPGIDADILLPILHDYIDGNVGKELAKYIVAITNVWIAEPGHKSVCKEFKASESAYKEAIDKHYCRNQYSGVRKDKIGKPFPEFELAAIRNNIKKRIEEINGDTSTP